MKTIVWDVDDVLNDLMHSWLNNGWLPGHPDCTIDYSDIVENPPHRIIGVSLEEYQKSLDAFRFAEAAKLKPIPEVHSWFIRYGSYCRHIVLTAVPLSAADISSAWVFKHFGLWIRSFNIIPSLRTGNVIPVYDKTKKDFLERWGKADILVEDNQVIVDAAHDLGIAAVLIPRPWNKSEENMVSALEYLTGLVI